MQPQLEQVDRNLQTIKTIEGSWNQPRLPDEVKLDLAGNTQMNPDALASFLGGIDEDFQQVDRPEPFPTRFDYDVEEPVDPDYAYDPPTRIGRTVAGITDLPVPEVYSTGAVRNLKEKLNDEGYLDLSEQEIASDRWLPEYSYAASQRNRDQMAKRFSGEKPGSLSVDQIMGFVDEWLSPRGLYRAAVELDLWWDTEAISEEFSDWDDDLKAWRDDPLNPRKLLDVTTGPLDDLLFPVLNVALMFTGIGEVMAVGRGVHAGVKGAMVARNLAGLHRGGRGLQYLARTAGDDIARFSRPSFLSQKLPQGNKVSAAMDGWRRNRAVVLGKKVNQQALRAGFSSNVQQLIDRDRGGASIDRLTGVGEDIHNTFTNPLLDFGVDIFFMPSNIFNPGTFSRPAKEMVEWTKRGFRTAADNSNMTAAWVDPARQYLRELDATTAGDDQVLKRLGATTGEEAADKFDGLVKDMGVKGALSHTFFNDDEELLGAAMGYAATMAAVDNHARVVSNQALGRSLGELDSGSREAYHHARNLANAKLKRFDPYNVEDVVNHITKYGDNPAEYTEQGLRRADQFQARKREVQDRFLESAEEAAARGGQVKSGHTRFVARMGEGGREWHPIRSTDEVDGDPFIVDVNNEELRHAFDQSRTDAILRGEESLPEEFVNRYMHHDAEGVYRHYRMSEAHKMRLYTREGLESLRTLVEQHNKLRAQFMGEIMQDMNSEGLGQYLYEVLPTFGKWGDFSEASAEIARRVQNGELENAAYIPAMSEANRQLGAMPWTPSNEKWSDEMFRMLLELPDDPELAARLEKSIFSPLARNVDPQRGAFTAARADTVTKQQALAHAATANRFIKMMKGLRKIRALPDGHDTLRVTSQYVDEAEGTVDKTGLREVLAEAFGESVHSETTLEELGRIGRFAQEEGVHLDDIERVLTDKLHEINASPRWADEFGVSTQLQRYDDVLQEIEAKTKELVRQSYFMASEVEGIPDDLARFLSERGYKLVHGVDFAQPMDLDGILPEFADATRRHLKQKSLGSFFARQDPKAVSRLKYRKAREALHARLNGTTTKAGRRLHMGATPDPDNADLNQVLDDLNDLLTEVREEAAHMVDGLRNKRLSERISGRWHSSRIPFSLDRLASEMNAPDFVERVMARGYSREQAGAMYQALQEAQSLGFKQHGLFAIESKLRSTPNLVKGMRLGRIMGKERHLPAGLTSMGATGGAFGGLYAGGLAAGDEPDTDAGMLTRGAGLILGGLAGGVGGSAAARAARRGLEAGNARALKWSYIADGLANLRDQVRFSLSPIFDASRYSEAIILSQVGEMPADLKRSLHVNQSPSKFRKMRAKQFRNEGLDADAAREAAKVEWERYQDEFAAAAMGYQDFDWETVDSVSRRFSSVGILGFSPVDWMSSTFAHLRRGGVDARKAYETVREIYTYGTTGRSAAELSMNFVFFPFSFTKKMVGHLSKFMADDLSRLVVLQDMMATYQALDENFDLSQEWRDRLPILERAHRLNALAYGVGLGKFGGINAPIIEGITNLIPGADQAIDEFPVRQESIVNAFIPQMVPMRSPDDADSAWETVQGMLPVFNDVETLLGSLKDQGHVLISKTHMTPEAEQRRAWDEWRGFQQQVEELLPEGMTWAQVTRNPQLNSIVQTERTRISHKYPSWKTGMGDGIAHSRAIEMELDERVQYPKSPGDAKLVSFNRIFELANQRLSEAGQSTFNQPEYTPPELFGLFRNLAIEMAKDEPEFLRLYNRFYRRTLGDITTEVTS